MSDACGPIIPSLFWCGRSDLNHTVFFPPRFPYDRPSFFVACSSRARDEKQASTRTTDFSLCRFCVTGFSLSAVFQRCRGGFAAYG